MPRFFCEVFDEHPIIKGEDARHISLVLRAKTGDKITLCDGHGCDYTCQITAISKKTVECGVIEKIKNDTEPNLSVTMFCGLPKGEKADYIIEKCTELGAVSIVFFNMIRCVAKIDKNSVEKKLLRYNQKAKSAAMQSGRGMIPKVDYIADFETAIALMQEHDSSLILYEGECQYSIKQAVNSAKSLKTLAIMSGCEGGFDESEIIFAKKAGIKTASMGKRILRCESAPVCALAYALFEL